MANINRQIAEELGVREQQVEATVALLDGGATVPFVARYRKEITGGLDDAQLRTLEERLTYLRELEERRTAILEFGPRTGQARRRAGSRHPGRRQQGPAGRHLSAVQAEAPHQGRDRQGSRPRAAGRTAADASRRTIRKTVAAAFVDADKQVADVAAALDGARAILVERFAEDADLIGALREQMWSNGLLASTVRTGKKTEGEKFKDYFDFSEPLHKLPSHRILALFRGEKEEILDLQMQPERASAPVAGVRRVPTS